MKKIALIIFAASAFSSYSLLAMDEIKDAVLREAAIDMDTQLKALSQALLRLAPLVEENRESKVKKQSVAATPICLIDQLADGFDEFDKAQKIERERDRELANEAMHCTIL